jgi:hypothetical protein
MYVLNSIHGANDDEVDVRGGMLAKMIAVWFCVRALLLDDIRSGISGMMDRR